MALGGRSVAEWQEAMSSHEFAEWKAYYSLQPFGEQRADLRMSILAAQITNVMTRSKESDPVVKADAFMPDFEKALDELEAREEVPEHELMGQKIRGTFGGWVKKP